MSTPDISAAMAQAMNDENQRRRLAADRPGHGAPVPLPQPPAGPGVGLSDNPLPVAGMGYSVAPGASGAQVVAYTTPNYAPDPVGGFGFQAGRAEPPIRRAHVTDLGDGRLFIEPRGDGSQPFTVVSPSAPRRGLLARLRERLRGRR